MKFGGKRKLKFKDGKPVTQQIDFYTNERDILITL
jgi:hypothetical protein